jgi:hypothetical protein
MGLTVSHLRQVVENTPAEVAIFDKEMKYLVASRRWIDTYCDGMDVVGQSHLGRHRLSGDADGEAADPKRLRQRPVMKYKRERETPKPRVEKPKTEKAKGSITVTPGGGPEPVVFDAESSVTFDLGESSVSVRMRRHVDGSQWLQVTGGGIFKALVLRLAGATEMFVTVRRSEEGSTKERKALDEGEESTRRRRGKHSTKERKARHEDQGPYRDQAALRDGRDRRRPRSATAPEG